jgi:hypothetical protein
MFKQIWFPEMIQQHILNRRDKEQLNSHYYATTYPDVYAAAERIFGSWGAAIEACGLDYNLIKKYKSWTRQTVLDEIKRLTQESEPLFSQNAQKRHKPLYMAAIKRFGNWGKAIQAAGVDYKNVRLRRSMTKADIKKEILALFRSGESLSYMNMRANYMYLQAAAMKKLGDGSWAKARRECGILTNYRLQREKRIEKFNN